MSNRGRGIDDEGNPSFQQITPTTSKSFQGQKNQDELGASTDQENENEADDEKDSNNPESENEIKEFLQTLEVTSRYIKNDCKKKIVAKLSKSWLEDLRRRVCM